MVRVAEGVAGLAEDGIMFTILDEINTSEAFITVLPQ